jgi:hypothetical protein
MTSLVTDFSKSANKESWESNYLSRRSIWNWLLEGSKLVFQPQKDPQILSQWYEHYSSQELGSSVLWQISELNARRSVIMMDKAIYSSVTSYKAPASNTNTADTMTWLSGSSEIKFQLN